MQTPENLDDYERERLELQQANDEFSALMFAGQRDFERRQYLQTTPATSMQWSCTDRSSSPCWRCRPLRRWRARFLAGPLRLHWNCRPPVDWPQPRPRYSQVYRCIICGIEQDCMLGKPVTDGQFPNWRCRDTKACTGRFTRLPHLRGPR